MDFNKYKKYATSENLLLSGIKVCICLALFAPLLFSSLFFFPFIFPKVILVRLLVEIALVFYIPLAVFFPKYRPKKNILSISILIFTVLVVITSITGINFNFSMWGNYERMDGIFSWAHYWVLFLISSSAIKTKKEWRNIFLVSIVVGLGVAVYGFLQRAGYEKVFDSGASRITSTLGNPGFVAAYLMFNITFAFLIAFDKFSDFRIRIFFGISSVILFYAALLAGIRGAFLGIVAGMVFFGVGYIFLIADKRIKRKAIPLLAVFLILLGSLFLYRENPKIQRSFLGRFFNVALEDSTVQTRLISWGGALGGVKENFLFGVGPQKFDVIFNKYFDPQFYALVGTETWWDRAHNMFIEVFSTMGIFGIVSYLFVGFSALWILFKIARKKEESRTESLIIASFLIAYFIQNLFIFDSINTYLPLALLLGFIVSRYFEVCFNNMEQKIYNFRFGKFFDKFLGSDYFYLINKYRLHIAIVLSLLFISPVAYAGNIRLIKHNMLFLDTLRPNQGAFRDRLSIFEEVLEFSNFDQREVSIKLGEFVSQYAFSNSMSVNDLNYGFNFSLESYEKALKKNPKDVRLLLSYGNTANAYGEILSKNQMQNIAIPVLIKAENAFLEAIDLGERRQQVFFSLVNTLVIKGDKTKAVDVIEKTIKINEDTPMAYWIASFVYHEAGDNNKAIEAGILAIEKGYRFSRENEIGRLAEILIQKKDYKTLLFFYENIASQFNTGSAKAKHAALLAQLGRNEEAIKVAREALARDPSIKKEVEEFIKIIESGVGHDFIQKEQ